MPLELVKPRPAEMNDASLHVSYSQLNAYLMCPMKYAHHYVYGTKPESKAAAMVFGRAIHRAAEAYYLSLKDKGQLLPADEMISVFEAVLKSDAEDSEVGLSFKKDENIESLRLQGIELLKLFHAEIQPQKIMAVEFPFSVNIPDINNDGHKLAVRLVGYFDLVESDGDSYLISELKTSSQRFSSLRLEYDLQPTVYSYAMTKMRLAKSAEDCLVRYDVLVKTKKPALEHYFVVRSTKEHERLIHLMNQVLLAIESRLFYRNMGWACEDCQYRRTCLE